MLKCDRKRLKLQELSNEIQTELKKLTNLISKRCNFCSTVPKTYMYSYEKHNISVFVCSNCIVKLALNDLYDQRMSGGEIQKSLLKKELQSLSLYIEKLLKDQQDKENKS